MAKNEANIHAYGDLDNAVYVSDPGATDVTLPDDLGEVTDLTEVGWISEDGLSESQGTETETYRAWQGATVVKKKVTSNDRSFSFSCLEENAVTQGLKYRGQEPTAGTGFQTITVKDQTQSDERSWVVDLFDGGHHKRYAIPRGFYEVTGEQTYSNSGLTMLEVTVTPIGEYDEITATESTSD